MYFTGVNIAFTKKDELILDNQLVFFTALIFQKQNFQSRLYYLDRVTPFNRRFYD